jgi:glycosyltransferase involved in cell wall biosynthesis
MRPDPAAEAPVAVSVVVPVRNAARYVAEAITSVLAQGNYAGEVIIVDDGSTDETEPVVAGFQNPKIRYLTNAGRGVSAARNTGARAARGEWLMFLDADDRLRGGATRALLRATAADPRAVVVYGDYDRIDPQGRYVGVRRILGGRAKPSGEVLEQLAAGNFIVNGGVMIVRSCAFAAVNGFDESLQYCEDWHCWCRLAAVGRFRSFRSICWTIVCMRSAR